MGDALSGAAMVRQLLLALSLVVGLGGCAEAPVHYAQAIKELRNAIRSCQQAWHPDTCLGLLQQILDAEMESP